MQLRTTFAWLLSLVFLAGCRAQGVSDLARLIPTCARSCIFEALGDTSCSLTDVECLCNSREFQRASSSCVLSLCGNEDLLDVLSQSSEVCHFPVRDESHKLRGIIIAFTALSTLIAIARIGYQLSPVGTGFSWDDGFIVITTMLNIPTGIMYVAKLIDQTGLGQDLWAIEWDQLIKFVNWFYVVEVLYFVAMTTLKTSILCFFWRIFGQTNLAWPIIGTLIFNAIYGTIFIFVGIFQCVPIIYTWTSLDYDRCVNVNAIIWSHAAISIALDFWMMLLPLWRIKSLQMPFKRKIAVALMLTTGIFVTIMSIVRLKSILVFTESINPTWDQSDVALWSTIEVNVGIICACMPTLRHIFMRLIPALAETSRRHEYDYSGGSRNARRYVRAHTPAGEKSADGKSRLDLGTKSTADSTADSLFKGAELPRQDSSVIVQTRDFVIDSDDEAYLVPMETLDPKKKKEYEIPKVYDLPT